MADSVSINKQEINNLILEISDYSSKVKTIFNKINDLMYDSKTFYDCSSAKIVYSRYSLLSSNYGKIVSNIMSYSSDLTNLKKKYASKLDDLSDEIKRDATSVANSKPIEYKERR